MTHKKKKQQNKEAKKQEAKTKKKKMMLHYPCLLTSIANITMTPALIAVLCALK